MENNEAREKLREEKFNLQNSLTEMVQQFESNTGLLVDKLDVIRNNLGYGDKTILLGIEATISI